jgi:HPt (histidine-containing phosphotransfer) domain-containing protein
MTSKVGVCDLTYLSALMGNKRPLINEILDAFLVQVPAELESIRLAISKTEYGSVKRFAHSMRSSVSILGIKILAPVLEEMETLGSKELNIERIAFLNQTLVLICEHAIKEIETERPLCC